MSALFRILRLIWSVAALRLSLGVALAALVLIIGAALMGVSGGFLLTRAGLDGEALIQIAPWAGGILALGRMGARYAERLVTHDATLRALTGLRVALMRAALGRDARAMARLRSEETLIRLTADVDALDGLILRLVVPVCAAVLAHLVVLTLVLGALPGVSVALLYLSACAVILWALAHGTGDASATSEAETQALRRRTIEALRDRDSLVIAGALPERLQALRAHDEAARAATAITDRAARRADMALSILHSTALAGVLLVGGVMVAGAQLSPVAAGIGVLVIISLGESLAPLARGFADLGRIRRAAQRVVPEAPAPARAPCHPSGTVLDLPTLGLSLTPGDRIAITGPSGVGKTTLLMQIAGLAAAPEGLRVLGHAPRAWPEDALRRHVAVLPQRTALISGTIRDNLALAAQVTDAQMWHALEQVDLAESLRARNGLDTILGEGGAGLSGGQTKRLALARVCLRSPDLLLLDEPTEGLDPETARGVLAALDAALPDTAILAVLHRDCEHPVFDRVIAFPAK